jgi:hypothetical protein
MNKSIFTLLFCLCFVISTLSAQTYSGGTGTAADPYLISSKADMEALATATNGNSKSCRNWFKKRTVNGTKKGDFSVFLQESPLFYSQNSFQKV